MIQLTGKVAIITGASRGIGAATAVKFADAGIRGLVISYNRDRTAAEHVVTECKRLGAEAISVRADVSRVAAVDRMVQTALAHFASVDILVANAGIWKEAAIEAMTERE